ncbi:MAG TPA: hypothetical protein VL125_04940 [Pelobium sp.]|nr:hypothetical protein [Pelobium sp.]
MTKKAIIEKTAKTMSLLPDEKAVEISDFAEFLFKRYEESQTTKGIGVMASKSKIYAFLEDEEELYSLADVKEPYNG